ncbi:MAG: zinc-binding dehydrogenase [Bacteroidetes bacterium]|nr:zinc-binding dehydrogenase [Bacteroidota bacterium]
MQVVRMDQFGEASVLQNHHVPIPEPAAGQVLIRVAAAGVNFSDILRRRNTYFMPTALPFVPGAEAVGDIVALGPALHAADEVPEQRPGPALQPGMRVLAILPGGGGYAEYALAPAAYCIPLPDAIGSAQATALFVQGCTAQLLLHQVAAQALGALEGRALLLTAAAGGVGSLLVQLARQAGARVIAAVGSSAKLEAVASLGAHHSVCYAESDWTEQVLAANNGQPVDLVLDPVGGRIYRECFQCLKPGGTAVVYGSASGEPGYVDSEHFVNQGQSLLSFNLAHWIQHRPAEWQAALGEVIGKVAQGMLQVPVTNTFALSQAAEAQRQVEARSTIGKVVLLP